MRMNCFDRRTLMELSLTLSSGFSKFSAIVRPAYMVLSWITLRIREALRGRRHERERLESLEPKDTVERFWGLKFIGSPATRDGCQRFLKIRWRQTMADLPGLRPQVVSPGRLRMVPEAMASKGRCGPGPAPSIT